MQDFQDLGKQLRLCHLINMIGPYIGDTCSHFDQLAGNAQGLTMGMNDLDLMPPGNTAHFQTGFEDLPEILLHAQDLHRIKTEGLPCLQNFYPGPVIYAFIISHQHHTVMTLQ